jgi:hypothetical protein
MQKAKTSEDKFALVMREFYAGKLKSSDGKIVTDVKQAQAIAHSESEKIKHKSMQKARIHKYIKRISNAKKGKGYLYFYTHDQWKEYQKNGTIPEQKESTDHVSIWSGIMNFFGLQDEDSADRKVHSEFEKHKDKFEGLTVESFTDYLSEYLTHKEKWDARINKTKGEKKQSTSKKEAGPKKSNTALSGGKKYNMFVMRTIAGIYGGKKEIKEPEKEKYSSSDNLGSIQHPTEMTDEQVYNNVKESMKLGMKKLEKNDNIIQQEYELAEKKNMNQKVLDKLSLMGAINRVAQLALSDKKMTKEEIISLVDTGSDVKRKEKPATGYDKRYSDETIKTAQKNGWKDWLDADNETIESQRESLSSRLDKKEYQEMSFFLVGILKERRKKESSTSALKESLKENKPEVKEKKKTHFSNPRTAKGRSTKKMNEFYDALEKDGFKEGTKEWADESTRRLEDEVKKQDAKNKESKSDEVKTIDKKDFPESFQTQEKKKTSYSKKEIKSGLEIFGEKFYIVKSPGGRGYYAYEPKTGLHIGVTGGTVQNTVEKATEKLKTIGEKKLREVIDEGIVKIKKNKDEEKNIVNQSKIDQEEKIKETKKTKESEIKKDVQSRYDQTKKEINEFEDGEDRKDYTDEEWKKYLDQARRDSDKKNESDKNWIENLNRYEANKKRLKNLKEKLMGPKMFKALSLGNNKYIMLSKGKIATIGETRTRKNGKKYKKISEGKWQLVNDPKEKPAEDVKPDGKPSDKPDEKSKGKDGKRGELKETIKKIANIIANALSKRDTVPEAGEAVKEVSKNFNAKEKQKEEKKK